jgi:hypothetical protein
VAVVRTEAPSTGQPLMSAISLELESEPIVVASATTTDAF